MPERPQRSLTRLEYDWRVEMVLREFRCPNADCLAMPGHRCIHTVSEFPRRIGEEMDWSHWGRYRVADAAGAIPSPRLEIHV